MEKGLDRIVNSVIDEYVSACSEHPKFNSAHEGWAVMKEEFDELWDEVKKKRSVRSIKNMEKEAKQIAAMGIRFIVDVCSPKEIPKQKYFNRSYRTIE